MDEQNVVEAYLSLPIARLNMNQLILPTHVSVLYLLFTLNTPSSIASILFRRYAHGDIKHP